MMNYSDFLSTDIRLCILCALKEDTDYTVNESVLQSILEVFGHRISRDKVSTELDWLAEQDLVTITAAGTLKVAKLTRRGLDVADGRCTVSGVKRPGPK